MTPSRRRSLDSEPAIVEETVQVEARSVSLEQVHDALERFWVRLDQAGVTAPGSRWRLELATAIVEVAGNVIQYAYPVDVPERSLRLRLACYADRVEALFVDRGQPFAPDAPASPDLDDLPEHGRGLAMARAALDDLSYRRSDEGENLWRLVKRLPG